MKKLVLTCLLLLFVHNVSKGERLIKYHWNNSKQVSIWLGGWSKHSNLNKMNEVHNASGLCINWLCYMKFTNSFNNPGEVLFVDGRLLDEKFITVGLRFSLIWGYEISPITIPIPYIGLGYKYLWLETTYFPDPEEPQEYLAFGVLRVVIDFN